MSSASSTQQVNAAVAHRYYEEFVNGGSFDDISMSDDLQFNGPMHDYADGARYRTDCAGLAANVNALTIKHQFVEANIVHTVYDFDLGLPSGPIPSAETLTFDNGVMIAAELIIDSAPLRPAGPTS